MKANQDVRLAVASESIASGLEAGALFAGRLGETELAIWSLVGSSATCMARLKTCLKAKINAGVWPPTRSQLLRFSDEYEQSFRLTTHVGIWGSLPDEELFLTWTVAEVNRIPLRALDPVLLAASGIRPWTEQLRDMRVLVISPYADLAKNQVDNRRRLFRCDYEVLPNISVVSLLPPQTQALEVSGSTWLTRLEKVKREVDRHVREVDAVLVAAGSYGMPLAAHAHVSGKPVAYMGGAMQLLFGIRGARWEGSSELDSVRGEGWLTLPPNRRPRGSRLVERGAYW